MAGRDGVCVRDGIEDTHRRNGVHDDNDDDDDCDLFKDSSQVSNNKDLQKCAHTHGTQTTDVGTVRDAHTYAGKKCAANNALEQETEREIAKREGGRCRRRCRRCCGAFSSFGSHAVWRAFGC